MGAHGGGALKLQQADVVQDVEGVVVLVEDDPGDLDVLLVGVHAVQLVGADGNAQTAGGLSRILIISESYPFEINFRSLKGALQTDRKIGDLLIRI